MISIEYIAGFFDGEGCIRIHKILRTNDPRYVNYKVQYQLELSFTQNDRYILELIQAEYGGSILKDRNTHKLVLSGATAASLLEDMEPYLVVKKVQASIALKYRATAMGRGNHLLKEQFFKQLQEAKRGGVA